MAHSVFGSSLAGDGMLVRLRSISIALLGLVTAVGLGLIAFISQLGFPGVFSGPIPDNPSGAGSIHDAVALTQAADAGGSAALLGHSQRFGSVTLRHAHRAGGAAAQPGLGGSRQLATKHGGGPNSELAGSPSVPVSGPTGQPTAPPPSVPVTSPSVPTVASAPQPNAAAQAKQHSDAQPKSNGSSPAKTKVDTGSKTVSTSVGKATSDQASDADAGPPPPPKSSESSSGKSSKDQSASTKAPAPTPTVNPAKDAPEVTSEAAAKEAADAGKSDEPSH